MSKKNQKRKVKIEKLNEEDAKVFERAEKIVKITVCASAVLK